MLVAFEKGGSCAQVAQVTIPKCMRSSTLPPPEMTLERRHTAFGNTPTSESVQKSDNREQIDFF